MCHCLPHGGLAQRRHSKHAVWRSEFFKNEHILDLTSPTIFTFLAASSCCPHFFGSGPLGESDESYGSLP